MIRRPDRHWPALAGPLLAIATLAACASASAGSVAPATVAAGSSARAATPARPAPAPAAPDAAAPATPGDVPLPATSARPSSVTAPAPRHTSARPGTSPAATGRPGAAVTTLATLTVKGRAPRTGYDRDLFGQAWADVDRNGCDTRNDILRRDLTGTTIKAGTHGCLVLTGTLDDPYTGNRIAFVRGRGTSNAVQIDHVVALSDAWQKGAQQWSTATRTAFANDPLNLLAVDGPTNQRKGDGDAATWLPPRKVGRCAYVARQISVKHRYALAVTPAERDAMVRVLMTCPGQALTR
ncbi:HNH endonuclease family protein [Pedococcus bigeumensis]|uniref:HNH endonuclease family protein n=1 Tax=Pedococcus bigeumensis TaxID=433644 RepID=UPI0031DC44FE